MLISIITVNYNDAIGLEKTIKSVQSQTFKNFEHIIIDGNSTDGSKAIIEKHKNSFSYWVSEPDSGIYNAMNKGIDKAKGEYLLFLNSGDYLYDDKVLEKVSTELKSGIDIYYGDLCFVDANGKGKVKQYPDELSFYYFFDKGHLPHPASFTKKTLFDKIGLYREKFKIVADWDFYVNAICKWNASYKHIGITVTNFDVGGISSQPEFNEIRLSERKVSLKDNFPLFIYDNKQLLEYDKKHVSKKYILISELEKYKMANKIHTKCLLLFSKIFIKNR